jgi:glutathione S-transferase
VPGAGLVPLTGTIEYARCFEFLAFLSSSVHIGYAQFRRPGRFLPPDPAGEEAFVEQGRLNTRALYLEIERRIVDPWVLGPRYRMADAYLLPFYLWGPRLGLAMAEDCPRWTAWKDRMLERPAVRRALEREGILGQLAANG